MLEAFLYEEQTRRGISLRHFEEMNDVADHCTVCHKCLNPCPVNIDFGDVTVRMRNILRERKQKRFNAISWVSMAYLNVKDPMTIKIMRLGLLQMGFKAQRLGHKIFKRFGLLKTSKRPTGTTGKPAITEYVVQFVKKPLPVHVPLRTSRAILGLEDSNTIPVIRNPDLAENERGDSVFYFPGCGSERLFSEVGIATISMLYETGATTVLPPGYLCCGYPQTSGGDIAKGTQISTDNRVLFHRVAQTLNYLEINTVIVSCGTCMDQLLKYEFEKIFPGCRLLDIHEYLLEKGVKLEGVSGTKYVYHDPCHTPIKNYDPTKLTSDLMGQEVALTDRCCGEAGTFAVTRPDIASQFHFRKNESLAEAKQIQIDAGVGSDVVKSKPVENVKILTNCPACQQGLNRYADDTGMETDYIVVEMMKELHGEKWQADFVEKIGNGGIEKVLL
jgi:Fe-S oxidoreductase